ncbi:DNA polymerase III subunit delta' [Pseudaestuariivita atlantica]|uniref:DNA polymerase III subunit delta n=1 Tax=Pseudaestuariivita atlantica TaxID=1317121 RepID=A0A0L1JTT8_9RHOB|nr:DNA polymerase III subunit delta' [Pseudaestuariivita atlantica]KNG95102.1 DNA polymerase III subunit delta' [Pseudaestuariivita atlantica]
MAEPELYEPDRIDGAPHPRETARLFGQDAAEAAFLDALGSGRLHHGWLLTGPQGVGKATLAWKIAAHLIANPPDDGGGLFGAPEPATSLDLPPDHPVLRRILAGSEPSLKLVRPTVNEKTGRPRTEIVVEDVRDLAGFFHLSATEGGRRVVIVDSADLLNTSAANALLKMLEEPPANAVLLLISHAPSRLLPTIRSRCRTLRLAPLGPDDMARALDQAEVTVDNPVAVAELSGGSVGTAIRLIDGGGLDLYAAIVKLAGTLPRIDRRQALALADHVAQRGKEARFDMFLDMMDLFLARLARTGAAGIPPAQQAAPGEATLMVRLAPDAASGRAWAQLAQTQGARLRHGRAVNLDPAALVLDTLLKLQDPNRALT